MNFTFGVQGKDGKPANDLEPYMETAGNCGSNAKRSQNEKHRHPVSRRQPSSCQRAIQGLDDLIVVTVVLRGFKDEYLGKRCERSAAVLSLRAVSEEACER
jgi:hypothetical protein